MSKICQACRYVNKSASRFCADCGVRLEEPPLEPVPAPPREAPSLAFGERRSLTVIFADLVGATQLVDRIDPEDLVDIMDGYHAAITTVAQRHRGLVSARLGDGMRILFGHPVAQEEAAHAAVRAGLEIVEAVKRLEAEVAVDSDVSLSVRVGVSTGTVVASLKQAAEGLEDNIVGSPLNIAARLQTAAAPNEVVISESTHRLVATSFATRDMGLHDLKGFRQKMRVFAVTGEIRNQSRLEGRLRHTLTPMVNRSEEQAILAGCWARARKGHSEFISIFGEAGIGKSRLAHTLAEQLEGEPHIVLWMQCKSTLANTALHPHIDLIERVCAIEPEDEPETRIGKLRALLREEGDDSDESLALLASLLSIPLSPDLPRPTMSPQLQKQRTFDVLLRLLTGAARREPVLLIYEDLHWMDPSSGELAAQIANHADSSALMVVGTSRPGTSPPWGEGRGATTIHLGRMSSSHSAEMVNSFQSWAFLPPSVITRIVEHTDGVPLFVEEMTRMVVDSGQDTEGPNLPETLRDLLAERLDRLGKAKTIAQIGAVIGRDFSTALVAATAGVEPESLEAEISQLLESGLVTASDDPDVLTFKHALVQDAAYGSLLARDRRDLHSRVAARLIAGIKSTGPDSPELIARHLKAAGAHFDAVQWWLGAGVQAIMRGAAAEAVGHLENGLDGLHEAPPGEKRQQAELELLALLGPAQMVRNGPGSPLFGDVQRRAFETMHILPGKPAQFPVSYGLALFHWARAEFATAHGLARELVATAQEQPTQEHIMAGNNMLAMVSFHIGQPRESRRLLKESVGTYDPSRHAELYPRYMMDFGVFGRFYLALASHSVGDAATTRTVLAEALPLAEDLHQPHSQGFAMLANFVTACWRRDFARARAWAERCIAFSGEQGFPEFVAMATIVLGWAVAWSGDVDEGLRTLDRGIALWSTTGFETWQTWFGTLRAELLLVADRSEDALKEIAAQEARLAINGELQFASLLASTKAQALERAGDGAGLVEACHRKAVEIAASQGAAAWQLQVSVAYARSLRHHGRDGEAHNVIASAIAALPPDTAPVDLIADWMEVPPPAHRASF